METKEKIKQLQTKLAETKDQYERVVKELSAKIEKLQELEDSLPKDEDEYFFIFGDGEITKESWFSHKADIKRWGIGNFFKTREEAENHLTYLKARKKLVDAIRKANEGWKPNWLDSMEDKYYFYAHFTNNNEIGIGSKKWTNYQKDEVYMSSQKVALQVKSKLGEEIIRLAMIG